MSFPKIFRLLVMIPLAGLLGASPAPAAESSAISGKVPAPVRNVILFVGDGMGIAIVTAARIRQGEIRGMEPAPSARLHLDEAPRGALVRTYSSNRIVSDSAATITSLVTGAKVANGVLSYLDGAGPGGSAHLTTLLEIAEAQGLATGIVTTTRVTHATPAGLYAHVPRRSQFERIAASLVPGINPALGDGPEIVLGGGLRSFLPEGTDGGRRSDGRNLVTELTEAGFQVVGDRDGLGRAVGEGVGPILGLFSDSHMAYECDRTTTAPGQPSLTEMTTAAIEVLSRDPDGFFLLVEGGRIDHALHEGNAYRAIGDMLEFDRALGEALKLPREETLILVTADHDHTMVISGYPPSGSLILGQAGEDTDGVPYTTLLFANGPGAGDREDQPHAEESFHPDHRQRAGVPLRSETHGGMDVPLYAFGPEWALSGITGSMDNTEVFGVLRDALLGTEGREEDSR